VMTDPAAAVDKITPVIDKERLAAVQRVVRDVAVPDAVQRYIVNLSCASRPGNAEAGEMVNKYVAWGAGVRASQYLALGAKARAAIQGRDAAGVEDVKAVALPVMRHRIGVNFRAENDGMTPGQIVTKLLETVKS
jgi:MoxR-like ATPase